MILTSDITGLVLAGGRATRMGGVDKGLQMFRGTPLAQRAARRLRAQTGSVAINANRHLQSYRIFGFPVWPDAETLCSGPADGNVTEPEESLWQGPLAGIRAGMKRCDTLWLATVACDSPLFPLDLVQRLAHAAHTENASVAIAALNMTDEVSASSDRDLRLQPVFSLLRVDLLDSLTNFLNNGGRKAGAWMSAQHCAVVVFDDARAFANVNTHAELGALEVMLAVDRH